MLGNKKAGRKTENEKKREERGRFSLLVRHSKFDMEDAQLITQYKMIRTVEVICP